MESCMGEQISTGVLKILEDHRGGLMGYFLILNFNHVD